MKSLFRVVFYALILFFFLNGENAFAAMEYDAFISLKTSGKIVISERLSFTDDEHFIRYLPRLGRDAASLLKYSELSLKKDGKDLDVRISFTGDHMRVYAADNENNGNGKGALYDFSYTVSGAVIYGENDDSVVLRLLDNDNGKNGELTKATAVMVFPDNVVVKMPVFDNSNVDGYAIGGKALFKMRDARRNLFDVGAVFTKGIAVITEEDIINPLPGGRWLLIVVFAYYMICWLVAGKDDDVGEIVPLSRPVHDLSVGKAAAVFFGKYIDMPNAIAASLLSLAQSGHIKIVCGRDDVVSVQRTACPLNSIPNDDDRMLAQRLFEKKDKIRLAVGNENKDDGEDIEFFTKVFAEYKTLLRKFAARMIKQNVGVVAVGVLLHLAISLGFLIFSGIPLLPVSFIAALTVPFVLAIDKRFRIKAYLKAIFGSVVLFLLFAAVLYAFYAVVFLDRFLVPGGNMPLLYVSFVGMVTAAVMLHAVFYHLMDKPGAAAVRLLQKLGGTNEFISAPAEERNVELTQLMFEENWPYAVIFNNGKKWQCDYSLINFSYKPEWAEGIWDENFGDKLVACVRRLYKNCALP